MKIKNNIKNFEVLRNALIIRTLFNEKTLIKCTMVKGQKTSHSLTFKIRFKHGGNTSIIFYTYENGQPMTSSDISDVYIKLIEMFNDIENASTIFVIDYGFAALIDTDSVTVTELTMLRSTIYYKVVIHNVLLQASTYMDGGNGLLKFIIDYMEDILK